MIAIISRDPDRKDVPDIVKTEFGGMHVEISTKNADVCSYKQLRVLHSRIYIIYDPLVKFAGVRGGQVIGDIDDFVDDTRFYTRLTSDMRTQCRSEAFLRAICMPSVHHHMVAQHYSWVASPSIIFDPDAIASCEYEHRELSDSGLIMCFGRSLRTGIAVMHVHVVSSQCIMSACARFLYEYVMASTHVPQFCRMDVGETMSVWLIGKDYYISILPVSDGEYDRYLAPRVRIRMSSRVTDSILLTHKQKIDPASGEDSDGLVREMLTGTHRAHPDTPCARARS